MMTIPSIDMMAASDMNIGESVSQQVADLTPQESLMVRQSLPQEMPAFGGLGELVADNAALGEALQSLVEGMDKTPVAPKAADMDLAFSPCPMQGSQVPVQGAGACVAEAAVASPVQLAEDRAVEAEVAVPVQGEADVVDETVVSAPTAKAADDSDCEPSDAVVLQAAPVTVMPTVDGTMAVSETTDDAVAAVSRVEAADLSTVFLAAADAVAAAVTVSPTLMRGEAGEIRVQLRPDVLEGSEVVVAVDGRKMDVTFVPTVTHVADTLAYNQTLMQNQLAARISGFEISVGVVQSVATNVAVNVGSARAAQMAVDRTRKTNGRA